MTALDPMAFGVLLGWASFSVIFALAGLITWWRGRGEGPDVLELSASRREVLAELLREEQLVRVEMRARFSDGTETWADLVARTVPR